MPQLHNETDKAQNKRLKAELANERALCGGLIAPASSLVEGIEHFDNCPDHDLIPVALGDLRALRAALKQANGKGL